MNQGFPVSENQYFSICAVLEECPCLHIFDMAPQDGRLFDTTALRDFCSILGTYCYLHVLTFLSTCTFDSLNLTMNLHNLLLMVDNITLAHVKSFHDVLITPTLCLRP